MVPSTWSLLFLAAFCLLLALTNAVVSPECERETHIIKGYSAVQEELHLALHTHIHGHAYDCNYTSMTEFVCLIEYDGQSPQLQAYKDFCVRSDVNGKIISRQLDVNHNLLGIMSFNVTFTGIPQCVGLSCDESTIERGDLQNNVFQDFINEMEVGDICDEEDDPWGELDFWSNFGVEIAAWSGIDLRECFSDPEEDDAEDGSRQRWLRRLW